MAVTELLMKVDLPGLGTASLATAALCVITHMALFLPKTAQSKIVYYASHLAFILIIGIFISNIFSIHKFEAVNINDLFYFHSARILQCVMFLVGAFRGNKEILDICRSYSKDIRIMRKLNMMNCLIFVAFGWTFSFLYYMEYLKGSRFDYITSNALFVYKDAPQFYSWVGYSLTTEFSHLHSVYDADAKRQHSTHASLHRQPVHD
jgi:hypothetical protein